MQRYNITYQYFVERVRSKATSESLVPLFFLQKTGGEEKTARETKNISERRKNEKKRSTQYGILP